MSTPREVLSGDAAAIAAYARHLGDLDTRVAEHIAAIEDELGRLLGGVPARVDIGDGRALVFGKLNGNWCLSIANADAKTRLASAPRGDRAMMLSAGHIRRLVVAAAEQIGVMIQEREMALDEASAIIIAFRSVVVDSK